MKEQIIKLLDRNVGGPIVRLMRFSYFIPRTYKPLDLDTFSSFLIIRPGGMGDAALLLPLIRYLRSRGKKVAVICNRRNKGIFDLFKKHKFLDEVFLLEKVRDVVNCSKVRFDCILDSEQSFYTSALIAQFIAPKKIIGFDTNERRNLYDFFVHYRQEEYEAQSFLNLLRPFGLDLELDSVDLKLPKLELQQDLHFEGRLLTVFGGAHMPTRSISVEPLQKALAKLSSHFDLITAIGTSHDAAHADAYLRDIPNARNMCGKTSLEGTLALLQMAQAFIGSDSGPLHLALLAGVPRIVGIFGPGIEAKWAHPQLMHVVTSSQLPCRPCNYGRFSQTPACPYDAACMATIRAEQIVSAILTEKPGVEP